MWAVKNDPIFFTQIRGILQQIEGEINYQNLLKEKKSNTFDRIS